MILPMKGRFEIGL